MATIEIPAQFLPYLQSAAVYTLAEEASRVRDGEGDVWRAENGPEEKLAAARDDLSNVRPFFDRMIPFAQRILALPAGQDAWLEDEPELGFYVFRNMASKVLGPRIDAELDYLPMPENVPPMAEALRWASAESIRLEADRVAQIRSEREAVAT